MALLGGLAVALLLIGAASGSRSLVVASVPLTLFLVLVRLLAAEPRLNVSVERSQSRGKTLYEGDKATVRLRLANLGPKVDVIQAVDEIPEGLRLEGGSNHLVSSLQAGAQLEAGYQVSAGTFGVYPLGPIRLRCLDASGLLVEERTLEQPYEVKVYPQVQYVSRLQIRPRNPRYWPGEIVTRKGGSGMEFFGLRPYSSSDPLRRINWKASSRSPELLSNQFMGEYGGDTIIVLDYRLVSLLGGPGKSTLTFGTRAAAVIAYRLLRDRNRVGLIALGDRLEKVRPGFGRRQFDRLLTAMVTMRAGDIWDIGNLPAYLPLFFSRMTQILVVSPLMDDKAFRAVAEVSERGYPVLVVSPSPLSLESVEGIDREVERLAERLARLERETKIARLRRCALVVDWDVRDPVGQALRQASVRWVRAQAR